MMLYDVIRQLMSGFDLNVVTASISPSVQHVRELHALSPPLAGRYALCNDNFVTVVKPWFLYWIISYWVCDYTNNSTSGLCW